MRYNFIVFVCLLVIPFSVLAEEPTGWFVWGKNTHKVSVDKSVFYSEPTSYSIEALSNAKTSDMGGLSQSKIATDNYKGKKVKLSGYLKGDNINYAFIWMQAHASKDKYAEGDIYIKGKKANEVNADWQAFEMIMTIPEDSETISFGFNLREGKIWIDDIKLKVVPKNTPDKFDNFVVKWM